MPIILIAAAALIVVLAMAVHNPESLIGFIVVVVVMAIAYVVLTGHSLADLVAGLIGLIS